MRHRDEATLAPHRDRSGLQILASNGRHEILERSKPLHKTLYHQIYVPPQLHEETLLINGFYARVDENRDRLARIFLYGTFHETAWVLLQEGLPNLVEVSLKSKSSIPRYGAI